jgi:predicted metal-dependent hydrolase
LNFHYKILDIAPNLQNYLIVHELCHLGEFNHSNKFWELVEKTIPDYKNLRDELKSVQFKNRTFFATIRFK